MFLFFRCTQYIIPTTTEVQQIFYFFLDFVFFFLFFLFVPFLWLQYSTHTTTKVQHRISFIGKIFRTEKRWFCGVFEHFAENEREKIEKFFLHAKKRSHLVYERFWYIDILCFDLHLMAIRTIFIVFVIVISPLFCVCCFWLLLFALVYWSRVWITVLKRTRSFLQLLLRRFQSTLMM